ncbi:MAG: hypothetical protein M1825_002741 [Sarcosagium campestre]|nr:MAG: hypothetical protein M1825_002741 [Sarcosagium campestre]
MAVYAAVMQDNGPSEERGLHPFFHRTRGSAFATTDYHFAEDVPSSNPRGEINPASRKRKRIRETEAETQYPSVDPRQKLTSLSSDDADKGSLQDHLQAPTSVEPVCALGDADQTIGQVDPCELASTSTEVAEILPRENEDTSSSRKMMRLSANGKLSSPPAKALDDTGKRRSSGRQKRKLAPVILKGGNSAESKRSFGQRVATILQSTTQSAAQIHSQNVSETPSKTIDKISTIDPIDKPTHPFFLGPSHPSQSGQVTRSAEQSREEQARHTSNAETRDKPSGKLHSITPKKFKPVDPPNSFSGFGNLTRSPGRSRVMKFPGLHEPLWPPRDLFHVRGADPSELLETSQKVQSTSFTLPYGRNKFKDASAQVYIHENILENLSARMNFQAIRSTLDPRNHAGFREPDPAIRRPQRLIISGSHVQRLVCREIFAKLFRKHPVDDASSEDELHGPSTRGRLPHPALVDIFDRIKTSLTPFDVAECEPQQWIHKYAPKSAKQVLQPGREASLLYDWLSALNVTSVDRPEMLERRHDSKKRSLEAKATESAQRKKRRKTRDAELTGFVISSDEEAAEMDEITDPEDDSDSQNLRQSVKRTVVRVGDGLKHSNSAPAKPMNAIVISGPHGSGKTAAAYAVAKELGFEVFEINSGSRRSGKDILEKVGDMTQNHLIQGKEGAAEEERDESQLRVDEEIESGKQGTMNTFFKPTKVSKREPRKNAVDRSSQNKAAEEKPRKAKSHKQSLILIEEADVLFEEDKQFWATVVSLIAQSKRPIILTCTDENSILVDHQLLHGFLRFVPPPRTLAVDYLLLVAANEGHILQREAVDALYVSQKGDVRATLTELDFWCQMAIGDKKSGLEWMYQRWPPGKDVDEHGETLRVVSVHSYEAGMGWHGRDFAIDEQDVITGEEQLLTDAWNDWNIEIEAHHQQNDALKTAEKIDSGDKAATLKRLRAHEAHLDALSAGDVFAGAGLSSGHQINLDPTQPDIPDRNRNDYSQDYQLIQADELVDHSSLSTHMGITTYCRSRHNLHSRLQSLPDLAAAKYQPIARDDINAMILESSQQLQASAKLTRRDLSLAFDPLAIPQKQLLAQPAGLEASAFDRPMSLLVTDLAPYVRTVIAHDVALEAERERLCGLLSVNGSKAGKRMRTTRASRSAWEGGARESKRRERWWDAKVNTLHVLATGGAGWQDIARETTLSSELGAYAEFSVD